MISRTEKSVVKLLGIAAAMMIAFGTGTAFAAPPDDAAGKGNAPASQAADRERPDQASSANADQTGGHQPPGQSGDTSNPQPASNADFSGNGANVHGPYDSTRDGSPSENGKGDGVAKGKPCAGCVGKADNKNPRGQLPNGSDPNAGYECDRNEGIGKSNPAHTACKPTPPDEEPPGEKPPGEKPPGDQPPGDQPPGEQPPGEQPPGEQPPAGGPAPEALPVTGVAVDLPLTAGLTLLAGGVALLAGGSLTRRLARTLHR